MRFNDLNEFEFKQDVFVLGEIMKELVDVEVRLFTRNIFGRD